MRNLLFLSVFVLFSCSMTKKQAKSSGSGANASLKGTEWTLNKIPDFTIETTRKPVTLTFSDSTTFYGFAGCNGFGGNFTENGNNLKLEKIMATKMACMPGMDTENRIMQAMMTTEKYSISGNKLVLMKGETVLAEFTRGKKDEK